MSRHLIATTQGHLIVGWDRPLQYFFIQVWVNGEVEDAVENDDLDEVIEGIKAFGAVAPSELRERLMLESSGWVETNFYHDWRTGPIPGPTTEAG